jgi:phosphatidylinositol kinase/protein kinase (PI-3  family)
MESKKKPLWLTMKNVEEDAEDIVLMLKVGDDLRQDALILQLLRVMDDLWRREGLNMQMMLYDCISTGHERGLLQVVLNATTLGNILIAATDKATVQGGGVSRSGSLSRKLSSAMKALSDFDVLKEWIEEQVEMDVPDDNEGLRQVEMERYEYCMCV